MNYEGLHHLLHADPPPGWSIVRYEPDEKRGGVYFWPRGVAEIIEPPHIQPVPRLAQFSMLFEFHVTIKHSARILARARIHAPIPENDSRCWRPRARPPTGWMRSA